MPKVLERQQPLDDDALALAGLIADPFERPNSYDGPTVDGRDPFAAHRRRIREGNAQRQPVWDPVADTSSSIGFVQYGPSEDVLLIPDDPLSPVVALPVVAAAQTAMPAVKTRQKRTPAAPKEPRQSKPWGQKIFQPDKERQVRLMTAAVIWAYGMGEECITGATLKKGRHPDCAEAGKVAAYLCYRKLGIAGSICGRIWGSLDDSLVAWRAKQVEKDLAAGDPRYLQLAINVVLEEYERLADGGAPQVEGVA